MSTRRGWQAMVGELDAVLRHLDIAQGADAQVRDGQLWIRHTPTQSRVAAVRIPAALTACPPLGRDLRCRGDPGSPPCDSLPHRTGAVTAPATSTPAHACGTRRGDSPLDGHRRFLT